MSSELLAGAATRDITPAAPQWLDGYGNRTGPSEGVYAPVTARALALRLGEARALLLSAEVLGFDRARVPGLKARIAAAAGVPPEAVVLAATHTHCAPRVCDMVMPGEVDPGYVAWFEERCVEAAAAACGAMAPVRVTVSRAVDVLGVNRRVRTAEGTVMRPNPDGPRDAAVETVWLEEPGGGVRASFTVAACHPTSRGGPLIGGDYPGFLLRELERAAGGVALFGLGCAGDVRPRFTTPEGRFRQAEPEEVREAGERMARDVLAAREERQEVPVRELRVGRRELPAPLAPPPGEAELRRTRETDPSPLRREWARRVLEAAREGLPEGIPFELQAILLAPGLGLLFLPGEVVADYALTIRRESDEAGRRVVPVAYANGAVGYVPSRRIYPEGGYEVNGSHPYYNLPAPYAPEVEDALLAASRDLLKDLN